MPYSTLSMNGWTQTPAERERAMRRLSRALCANIMPVIGHSYQEAVPDNPMKRSSRLGNLCTSSPLALCLDKIEV